MCYPIEFVLCGKIITCFKRTLLFICNAQWDSSLSEIKSYAIIQNTNPAADKSFLRRVFFLYFLFSYAILSTMFYRKEGAPVWVGTAAFSLKKETPKFFRLEVRPFSGKGLQISFRQSVGQVFLYAARLCCGAFLFCPEPGCTVLLL